MTKLPFLLAALAIGGAVAIQPILNADVARRLGNPFVAAFLSISVSFVIALAYVVVTRQHIPWSGVVLLPWYLWFAGSIGLFFVAGTLWLAPILGAAALFAAIIAGQMITATVVDWIGFGNTQAQHFDPLRIVAILLVLGGVVIFQRTG